jgi:hypothetical protein
MYFASQSPGAAYNLYFATAVNGVFGPRQQIVEIAAGGDAAGPVVSLDKLTLFFTSNRAGGPGGADTWISKRASASDPWGSPQPVNEVNSPNADGPSWISADGCRLYLHSDRSSPGGNRQVFLATRPPK